MIKEGWGGTRYIPTCMGDGGSAFIGDGGTAFVEQAVGGISEGTRD